MVIFFSIVLLIVIVYFYFYTNYKGIAVIKVRKYYFEYTIAKLDEF